MIDIQTYKDISIYIFILVYLNTRISYEHLLISGI